MDYFIEIVLEDCLLEQLKLGNVNILITEELYKEILKYVTQSEDMEYEQSEGKLVFRLKDEVDI